MEKQSIRACCSMVTGAHSATPEHHAMPAAQLITKSAPILVRLAEHVCCNVLNVLRRQLVAKGWHGAIAIGGLLLNQCHAVLAVLLQRLLLQLLLGDNVVVAASVACCTVSIEDRLTVLDVGCQGSRGPANDHGSKESQGRANGQWTPS